MEIIKTKDKNKKTKNNNNKIKSEKMSRIGTKNEVF